jgi:hypothetical protein
MLYSRTIALGSDTIQRNSGRRRCMRSTGALFLLVALEIDESAQSGIFALEYENVVGESGDLGKVLKFGG